MSSFLQSQNQAQYQYQLQPPPINQQQSRSRSGSNPWLQYSDFFTNNSFLIPDTIAFAKILPYFKALPNYSSRFNIRLVELVGYEAYFVEQWISSRSTNNLIVTYTGDLNDRLIAYHVQALSDHMELQPPPQIHEQNKLNSSPKSQNSNINNHNHNRNNIHHLPYDNWPPKFISYLVEQLESPFCVATETSLGYAFITNLTQLNPFLSLIDAKTGNIKDDYNCYVVNYNLRKLGCGSRSAATIDEPTKSMEDKFKTTFKIDPKVSINYASVDLILITQTFLYYYGLLDSLYCDGLFCDKTDNAIKEWWRLISEIPMAAHLIRIKPPTSHAADSIQAIIGFTVLCRYLLELGGNTFNISKDPMDVKRFKVSISKFQKHHKIDSTSKLNLETLIKLMEWGQNNKVSQNLTKDLSKMKDLVKNTVIDITSGKNLQMIAHNATASPFYLHSHSSYDQAKLINCQNLDNIKHMSLGKQLNYLFYANGKPIDLHKDALSVLVNKKVADSTTNNSLIDGVKRLKSQLSIQSIQSKSHNDKGLSATALNILDKDHDNNYDNNNEVFHDDVDIDEILSDGYNENSQKKKKRSPSSIFFSSEDEASPPEKTDSNNRSTSLANFDYDDYNNDVAIYNPIKNKFNNHIAKSNSLGATNSNPDNNINEYDHYPDYDGDYTNNYYSTNDHNRGTSFSSNKIARKIDMNNIDEALIDDELSDSEYYNSNRSNTHSRRNTDYYNKIPTNKDLKSFYSPPHMISTGDLSVPASRVNSVNTKTKINARQHISKNSNGNIIGNDVDSDGVYEYENGYGYEYELDSNNQQSNYGRPSSRRQSNMVSSKEHSRRPSSSILGSNDIRDNLGQINTAFSTQTNLVSSNDKDINYECNTNLNIDYDYMRFMKRVKRRHSIPLVDYELNKYSIEMERKRDKIENAINNNLERQHSWAGSRKSNWDRSSLNYNDENKTNGFEKSNNNKNNNNKGTNRNSIGTDIINENKESDDSNNGNLNKRSDSNNNNNIKDNKHDSFNEENDSNFLYRMKRKQSIFGTQSIITDNSTKSTYVPMDVFIIYHRPVPAKTLRRSQSFSAIENSMICSGKGSAIYGFEFSDVSFLTAEILAMRYLKLEREYQIEMVQGSFNLTKDLKYYSKALFDSINQEKNPSTCVSIKYNSTRGDIKKVVGKYFELEDKLKNTVKSNARLKYELRLLLQKTKEVENNLKTLQDFKINTLNDKLDSMISELTKYGKNRIDPELRQILEKDNKVKPESSKDGNETNFTIIDKLFAADGKINWKKLSFKSIWSNPYILIYLFFHVILCTILRRVDAKMVEQRWKQIDKNQTVTMILRKLYSKSESEAIKEDMKEKKQDESKKDK